MPKYQLKAKHWDGEKMHAVHSVLEFEEGRQPKGSVLVEEPKPTPAVKKGA